jgi:hypothetical protein
MAAAQPDQPPPTTITFFINNPPNFSKYQQKIKNKAIKNTNRLVLDKIK